MGNQSCKKMEMRFEAPNSSAVRRRTYYEPRIEEPSAPPKSRSNSPPETKFYPNVPKFESSPYKSLKPLSGCKLASDSYKSRRKSCPLSGMELLHFAEKLKELKSQDELDAKLGKRKATVCGNDKGDEVKSKREYFTAIRHANLNAAEELLLLQKVSPSAKDAHGNSALHVACQNGNKKVVKFCLRHGNDINAQNKDGNTPLHYCFTYKYKKLAWYLLSKGARRNIPNKYGLIAQEGLTFEKAVRRAVGEKRNDSPPKTKKLILKRKRTLPPLNF